MYQIFGCVHWSWNDTNVLSSLLLPFVNKSMVKLEWLWHVIQTHSNQSFVIHSTECLVTDWSMINEWNYYITGFLCCTFSVVS